MSHMKNKISTSAFGKFLAVCFLSTALFSTGCKYDSEEDLYGDIGCQTDNVTYSDVVLPLLENHCMGCHSAIANFGGVTLEGYDNLKTFVDNGQFLGAIRHDDGFAPMPQGGNKFVDCNIEKIEAWINEGAPEN